MKKVLWLIGLVMNVLPAFGRITGTVCVADSVGEPLAGATVVAVSLPDSVKVDGAVSDADGRFVLDGIVPEDFSGFLNVSCVGYVSADVPVARDVVVKMSTSSTDLKEIVVKARSMRAEAGKYVFTPGDMSDVAPVAWDVLDYTPMLRTGESGVSVNGIGEAKILINGEDMHMPAEVLKQYLSAFPPGRISKIEIVTNPGPRYAGVKCLVNIIMKDTFDGVRGALNAAGTYGYERVSPDGSLWLGTSFGKFRLSGYAAGRRMDQYKTSDAFYEFHTVGESAHNSVAEHSRGNTVSGGLTLSYKLSPSDDVSIGASIGDGSINTSRATTTETALGGGTPGEKETTWYTSSSPFGRPGVGVRASYVRTLGDSGNSLSVYGALSKAGSKTTEKLEMPDAVELKRDKKNNRGASVRIVLEKTFGKKFNLTAGYDLTAYKVEDRRDETAVADYFDYTEVGNALYADLSCQWSDAVSASVGFRGEFEHLIMRQNVTGENYTQKNFHPLPNASVAFNLPHSRTLSLDYSADLRRPFMRALNPLVRQVSENEYASGNPALKSYINHAVSLNWNFLEGFRLSTTYMMSNDGYIELPLAIDGTVWRTYSNAVKSRYAFIYLNYMKRFFDNHLLVDADLGWTWRKETMPSGLSNYNLVTNDWMAALLVRGAISTAFKLNGYVQVSPVMPMRKVGEFSGWNWRVYAGLSKFFNFGGKLELSASNILNSRFNKHFDSADYSYQLRNHGMWVDIRLSFAYYFGSNRVKQTGRLEDVKGASRLQD